jgi:hypothetical protein
VNEEVQGNGNPRDRGRANELGVAEKSGGTMVVAVKEGQRLLLEKKENGVKKLQVLGKVGEIVQDNEGLGPTTIGVADGMEDTAANDSRKKLLNVESQKSTANNGQVEVVDEEKALELEGLAVAHELTTAEDYEVVDDDKDGCGLEGRHGRLEGDELELGNGISYDGRPCLVEDWP